MQSNCWWLSLLLCATHTFHTIVMNIIYVYYCFHARTCCTICDISENDITIHRRDMGNFNNFHILLDVIGDHLLSNAWPAAISSDPRVYRLARCQPQGSEPFICSSRYETIRLKQFWKYNASRAWTCARHDNIPKHATTKCRYDAYTFTTIRGAFWETPTKELRAECTRTAWQWNMSWPIEIAR